MHYVHVKRKEHTVNRITLQEFQDNPDLRRRLHQQARQERIRAVRAGVAWLGKHIQVLLTPARNVHPARWIARLG